MIVPKTLQAGAEAPPSQTAPSAMAVVWFPV